MSTLRLHNTLTGKSEPFTPLETGKVRFYSCGPTVYDYAHIGNFRSFLVADVLRRWLESPLCARVKPDGAPDPSGGASGGGYEVAHVMNITDVGHMTDDADADGAGEDKMEAAGRRLLEAKKAGTLPEDADIDPRDPHAIADYYTRSFLDDARMMGLKVASEVDRDPSLMPRPTQHVESMLRMVMTLLKKGHAYIAADGVAYFDTQSFPDYGRLSGNTIERLRAGAGGRVSQSNQAMKKHPADFMLWKPDPTHLMRWDPRKVLNDPDCPLLEGYPGWHLECSAMALERLAPESANLPGVIDIHSGGEDNIFPHHECEIAQSRCATGADAFSRHWLHVRHLMVEGQKMSKSAGNFYTIRDLVSKGFHPAAIRLELIRTHYRSNANFTEQGLLDSQRLLQRWHLAIAELMIVEDPNCDYSIRNDALEVCRTLELEFAKALNDDLNISAAIGAVATEMRELVGSCIQRSSTPFMESDTEDDRVNMAMDPTHIINDANLDFVMKTLRKIDSVLGMFTLPVPRTASGDLLSQSSRMSGGIDSERVNELLERRTQARKNKDFAEADRIRDQLAEMGVEIKDGPQGTTWSRKAAL